LNKKIKGDEIDKLYPNAKAREKYKAFLDVQKAGIERILLWSEQIYRKDTNNLIKELDVRKKAIEKYTKEWADLKDEQKKQAETFEERMIEIKKRGLSEAGQKIQDIGFAKSLEIRANDLIKVGNVEEARRILQKAQDRFYAVSQYAVKKGSKRDDSEAIAGMNRTQDLIKQTFKTQEQKVIDNLRKQEEMLRQTTTKLKKLQKEAQIKLELIIDNNAIGKKLNLFKELIIKTKDKIQKAFTQDIISDYTGIKKGAFRKPGTKDRTFEVTSEEDRALKLGQLAKVKSQKFTKGKRLNEELAFQKIIAADVAKQPTFEKESKLEDKKDLKEPTSITNNININVKDAIDLKELLKTLMSGKVQNGNNFNFLERSDGNLGYYPQQNGAL